MDGTPAVIERDRLSCRDEEGKEALYRTGGEVDVPRYEGVNSSGSSHTPWGPVGEPSGWPSSSQLDSSSFDSFAHTRTLRWWFDEPNARFEEDEESTG